MNDDRRYGIAELAELGGVSRRTVRYYVQRGLLPAPMGTGRGDHYTEEHVGTLVQIRKLQEAGVPLAEIPARLGFVPMPPGPEPPGVPPPVPGWPPVPVVPPPRPAPPGRSVWTRLVLADGVELHVREGLGLPAPAQLAWLEEAVRQIFGTRSGP
jgi:hypothetical protein